MHQSDYAPAVSIAQELFCIPDQFPQSENAPPFFTADHLSLLLHHASAQNRISTVLFPSSLLLYLNNPEVGSVS